MTKKIGLVLMGLLAVVIGVIGWNSPDVHELSTQSFLRGTGALPTLPGQCRSLIG
ncbi:hypothetical protein [Spirosoma horti]